MKKSHLIIPKYTPFKLVTQYSVFGDEEGFRAKDRIYKAVVVSSEAKIYEIKKSVFNILKEIEYKKQLYKFAGIKKYCREKYKQKRRHY